LKDTKPTGKICDDDPVGIIESAAGAAQFYVFVGVMVFLYCLAALVLYVLFDSVYRKYNACTCGVCML